MTSVLNRYEMLFRCPKCERGDLHFGSSEVSCRSCGQRYPWSDGIPMLFWPDDPTGTGDDVTDVVREFYEETPFPDYNDFDSVASLSRKAREGIFARMLDEQLPPGSLIAECGCGTGQLSSFLSIANRTVFACDLCENSLRLGQKFARDHNLDRVHFVQMNLFRPVFKPETFDLVISNGVLMTTPDPFLGFKSIARLVKPGGHILIGLYHRYGRLGTDLRRVFFRLTGDRFLSVDPNLRDKTWSEARRRAWFADQYKHPREVKHTIGQVLPWLREAGFSFVRSLPRSKPFRPFSPDENLFEPEEPGTALERLTVELGMTFRGGRDGGFFNIIGRKD